MAAKKQTRPTWTAIKKYVEGRLADQRRYFKEKWKGERKARKAQSATNDELLESTAREVVRQGNLLREQDDVE